MVDSYDFLRNPMDYEWESDQIENPPMFEEIQIRKGIDIPLFEAGYELKAKDGEYSIGYISHREEKPTVVRGHKEQQQHRDRNDFDEVNRRGPGGTVPHTFDGTDCFTVALPVETNFRMEKGWQNFAHGIMDYLEELGAENMYIDNRDILIEREPGVRDTATDPQIAGTSIKYGKDYAVLRSCVKNRWDDALEPVLEAEGVETDTFQDTNIFTEEEYDGRFRDVITPVATPIHHDVERWLENEGLYEEARRMADETQNKPHRVEPELCSIGHRTEQTS